MALTGKTPNLPMETNIHGANQGGASRKITSRIFAQTEDFSPQEQPMTTLI
jgi:hypothetical protein